MILITSNAATVAAFLHRIEEGQWGRAMLRNLERVDLEVYRVVAQGALSAVMLPEERRFLSALVETVAVALPANTRLELSMGRPPNLIERAQSAVGLLRRAVTRAGRPRLAGMSRSEEAELEQKAGEMTLADLHADVAAAHELIQAWVATPFTSREDMASGKDRDVRDAGDTDEEIVERLEYILGLRGRRGQHGEAFIPDHPRADRERIARGQVPLEEAQAGLVHALGRFAQAQLGPDSQAIPAGRLADLFAAVLVAWRALIHNQLHNGLAHAALLDVRQGSVP